MSKRLFEVLRERSDVQNAISVFEDPDLPKDWFCGLVILRGHKVLVLDYQDLEDKRHGVTVKFPGGKRKWNEGTGRNDGSPRETAVAEALEEVFRPGTSDEIVTDVLPFKARTFDPRRRGDLPHTKFFCLLDVEGDLPLRTEEMHEGKEQTENLRITDEILGPPRFEPLNNMMGSMFPGHKRAAWLLNNILRDVVPTLAVENADWAFIAQGFGFI